MELLLLGETFTAQRAHELVSAPPICLNRELGSSMPSIFAPLPLVPWQPRGNYRVNVYDLAGAVVAQGLVWKVVPAAELDAETQSLAERLAVFILPPFRQSSLRICNAVKAV